MSKRHNHSNTAAANSTGKACSHTRHVGTCASCQRAQLHRWSSQLAEVQRMRAVGAAR
jgi:hypothetical protein